MKKIKILLGVFIISCIFCATGVKATSFKSWVSLTIPALSKTYTSDAYQKTVFSDQYAKKDYATDKLSGDERAIQARLQNITTSWTDLPKGSIIKLNAGSTNLGQAPGTYKLQLRAKLSTVTEAYFGGHWYLDDTLI